MIALVALTGCERGDPPPDVGVDYGDAVGIRIEGAHLAPYQVLFAVDQGADVRPLVQPLSSVVHAALLACPSSSAPSEVVTPVILAFAVDAGRLRRGRPAAPDGAARAGESCLIERLEGRPLLDAASLRHLLLQIRLAPVAPDAAPARQADDSP